MSNGGATPTHTYSSPGTYTVSLTVTDADGTSTSKVHTGQAMSRNGGDTATTSRQVTVAAAGSNPSDPTVFSPGVAIRYPKKNQTIKRRKFRTVKGKTTVTANVSKIQYGVARRVKVKPRGKSKGQKSVTRCLWLRASGRLYNKKRSCTKPIYLNATGIDNWSGKLKKPLPKGHYLTAARAKSTGGTTTKPITTKFKLR